MSKITLVTGIWDIGRSGLTEGWSRPYQHYLDKFEKLLEVDCNLIIFGDKELEEFVYSRRDTSNTQFINRDLSWFTNSEFFEMIQKIRTNPDWYNQVGWLKESTQARLENYNPLVMSKVYLLHDAKIMDKFNSEYLFWIDGGLTNTVHPGYFTHDKVLDKLDKYISKFSFVCFPYDANTEIHGFEYNKLNELAGAKVNKVARGGFFGGPKDSISEINAIYYGLMKSTLAQGYMGTEESIFSIMSYKFKTLIDSMLAYDKDYINKTTKFLLDNSSDETTFNDYKDLCEKYGFEHIKKDNLGICGGRQWIAEHFQETDLDFYLFFEDDMFFYPNEGTTCRNGFNRYVENLFVKSLEIMQKENFDFLKMNYSEFYGDNGTQWSWYNVPQSVRSEFWPVSRPGNQRMFLDVTWAHPFEQTWMSHMYQLVKKGELNPGLLLMTPTEHDRFEHYDGKLRKES